MLKYISKLAMDILPSVAGTIMGLYRQPLHRHQAGPPRRPVAAAVSPADPKKARTTADTKSAATSADAGNIPQPGRPGQGHLRKGHARTDRRRTADGRRKTGCSPSKNPWKNPWRNPWRSPPTGRRKPPPSRQICTVTRRRTTRPSPNPLQRRLPMPARALLPPGRDLGSGGRTSRRQ